MLQVTAMLYFNLTVMRGPHSLRVIYGRATHTRAVVTGSRAMLVSSSEV